MIQAGDPNDAGEAGDLSRRPPEVTWVIQANAWGSGVGKVVQAGQVIQACAWLKPGVACGESRRWRACVCVCRSMSTSRARTRSASWPRASAVPASASAKLGAWRGVVAACMSLPWARSSSGGGLQDVGVPSGVAGSRCRPGGTRAERGMASAGRWRAEGLGGGPWGGQELTESWQDRLAEGCSHVVGLAGLGMELRMERGLGLDGRPGGGAQGEGGGSTSVTSVAAGGHG